jgi:Methyltransferase domain
MKTEEAHSIAYKAVYEHFALQKVHELTFLLTLIRPTDNVLEIGCDAGGTTWAIKQTGATHFGIDLPGDRFSSGFAFASEEHTNIVWGDSHSMAVKDQMLDILDRRKIDVLIIDGDHTYNGVQNDFYMYTGLCNGLTIFHDICEHPDPDVGVAKFYDSIKVGYNHIEYMSEPMDWGGIGCLDMGKLKRRVMDLNHAITA